MSPELIQFPVSDPAPITAEAGLTLTDAQAVTVADAASYARAGQFVQGLKSLSRRITEFFADDIDRAFKLHRSLTKKRSDAVAPLDAECTRLGREMAAWDQQQERLRRDEEIRLSHLQQEQDRAVALAQAAALESQGMPEQAAAVVEEAIAAPAPLVSLPPSTPRVEGISYRSTWRHRVVDAQLVPREYLVVNEQAIAAVVRATRGAVRIPGIDVFEDRSTVVRSA